MSTSCPSKGNPTPSVRVRFGLTWRGSSRLAHLESFSLVWLKALCSRADGGHLVLCHVRVIWRICCGPQLGLLSTWPGSWAKNVGYPVPGERACSLSVMISQWDVLLVWICVFVNVCVVLLWSTFILWWLSLTRNVTGSFPHVFELGPHDVGLSCPCSGMLLLLSVSHVFIDFARIRVRLGNGTQSAWYCINFSFGFPVQCNFSTAGKI